MTDDEPYEMTCHCGRPSCRGTITGFDWCKREIQAKYAGFFHDLSSAVSTSLREPAPPHNGAQHRIATPKAPAGLVAP
jgi:hypothetical protein